MSFFQDHRFEILTDFPIRDLILHLYQPKKYPLDVEQCIAGLDESKRELARGIVENYQRDRFNFKIFAESIEQHEVKLNERAKEGKDIYGFDLEDLDD